MVLHNQKPQVANSWWLKQSESAWSAALVLERCVGYAPKVWGNVPGACDSRFLSGRCQLPLMRAGLLAAAPRSLTILACITAPSVSDIYGSLTLRPHSKTGARLPTCSRGRQLGACLRHESSAVVYQKLKCASVDCALLKHAGFVVSFFDQLLPRTETLKTPWSGRTPKQKSEVVSAHLARA